MWKKIALLQIALLLLAVAGASYLYWQLDKDLRPNTSKPQVVGLPSSFNLNAVIPPYDGPHPANIDRPDETFEFPIQPGQVGPSQSLFAGPNEYPFLCMTQESGLGQPLVDNQEGAGMPVYELNEDGSQNKDVILGYSKDCGIKTQVQHYYQLNEGDRYLQYKTEQGERPDAHSWLRIEVGTINRFMYALVIPTNKNDTVDKPDTSRWNKKLIYHFKGGISMGFKQGVMRLKFINKDMQDFYNLGYAVAYSTGNETSSHYNMWLAEDTALRVKEQFTSQFGEPDYTVGFGGSGGGLQQYLLAQNHPGIIDAGIALYSYPDMITQTPYSLDCELLEYYFDVTASYNKDWNDHDIRQTVLGVSSINEFPNSHHKYQIIADLLNFDRPYIPTGASTCSNGWRGSHSSIHNPKYNGDYYRFAPNVLSHVQFSHWNNLVQFYGTDENGWANSLFDNQGVQYGLKALTDGHITVESFLHLNSHVGSWKPQSNMQNEHYWHLSGEGGLSDFKIWSQHNMNHEGLTTPLSKRSVANPDAIKAAYLSGQIYLGKLDIPMIDLRPYKDDQLDIHHSWSSLSARLRMSAAGTNTGQQVIWTTSPDFDGYLDALAAMDRWVNNIKAHPTKTITDNRPSDINDRCYDEEGRIIYNGPDAWNGPWNDRPEGECAKVHPPLSSARIQAGDSYLGETLKCQLQSIEQAVASGLYDPIDMTPHLEKLKTIFPDGVCDYGQQPVGKPELDIY